MGGPKLTTRQEWMDYQELEWGNFHFSLSFKNIYSIAALLALCWYANGVGALTAQMQTAQTAYLYHGLKEGTGAGTGYSLYCEPIILTHGSWETFGQAYVGWDCGRQKTKADIMIDNINSHINYSGIINVSGLPGGR